MPFLSLLIKQLKDTFPDSAVYDEPVQQGLKMPAFIISKQHSSHKRKMHKYLELTVNYIVTYIPKDDTAMEDIWAVESRLYADPAWRYLGGKLHLSDLSTEINNVQKVLKITFKVVSEFKYIIPSEEPMKGIWVGTTIYDPIDNPGVDPNDPNHPDNPGNPNDPDDPDAPVDMGTIIIN